MVSSVVVVEDSDSGSVVIVLSGEVGVDRGIVELEINL